MLRRYSEGFALKVEKLRNYWTIKKYWLVHDLVSYSSLLNLLIQLVAFVAIDYSRQVAWVTFFAAIVACGGAVASLIVIPGVPRWMQWLIVFMAQILVGVTGYGLLTGCDIGLSAFLLSWVMLTAIEISEPGLNRYVRLEDEKFEPLTVIEFNMLKREIVLRVE